MNAVMRWFVRGWVAPVLCLLIATTVSGRQGAGGTRVFELEEVSGFDVGRVHPCGCESEPAPGVVYPEFSSAAPLYGLLRVDLPLMDPQSGTLYHFALDESGGTDAGYDRLYIDLNRNNDLSDERAITPLESIPAGALRAGSWIAEEVCFGYVTFSSVDDVNETYSVETMPRLTVSDKGYISLCFVATKAYEGEIEIAGQRFDVTMANGYPLGTRWDRPTTFLELRPQAGTAPTHGDYFSSRLVTMHEVNGRYWRLSTTPTGGSLFVTPYQGDLGTLTMAPSWSLGSERGFAGALITRDWFIVVGEQDGPKPVRACQIPVGDYAPVFLAVCNGSQLIHLSNSYPDNGLDEGEASARYPFEVRKDTPCVIDLTGKAEIRFRQPARNMRLKPGEELSVRAVLADPKLGIVVERLSDRASVSGDILSPGAAVLMAVVLAAPLVVWLFSGRLWNRYRVVPILSISGLVLLAGCVIALQVVTQKIAPNKGMWEEYDDELRPGVTIARSDGGVVARSVLSHRYSWRIPDDFRMKDNEETMTITVTYDTHGLYGTVTGTRQFTVYRDGDGL